MKVNIQIKNDKLANYLITLIMGIFIHMVKHIRNVIKYNVRHISLAH